MGANVELFNYFKRHDFLMCSYHEAGHTVYGLLHNIKVDKVHVFEDQESNSVAGLTYFDLLLDSTEFEHEELVSYFKKSEICINYAGLIAERVYYKNISGSTDFPNLWKSGSSDDTSTAAALIRKYNLAPPGKKRLAFKKKLIETTTQELSENWDAITIIAHALFKHKKLSFDDLKKLLTTKTENKKMWRQKFKNIKYIHENIEDIDEKNLVDIMLR